MPRAKKPTLNGNATPHMQMPTGTVEGTPDGLNMEGDYRYVGSVNRLYVAYQKRNRGGDLIDILFGNKTTQFGAIRQKVAESKGMSDETREELVDYIGARLDALTYLAAECLRSTGIDTENRSGISLRDFQGGPIVSDTNGSLWHYIRPSEAAQE